MAYLIWCGIGVAVALVFGVVFQRLADRVSMTPSVLAGTFGGLLGGIVGDGVPHSLASRVTLWSVFGACVGALIFSWALRPRATDSEL